MYNKGGDPDTVAGEFGIHPLYKMLGYFSLIGLLRLHSLLGDYFQAIKVLENVELNKKVSLIYYRDVNLIGLLQLTITWYKIRHAGGQAHYYSPTGTLKQRDLNQSSLTCLFLMSQWGNNNELALQHDGFCTM